ncbi:MAG: CRTAC1 family protein [Paracoccaceae bacterium]
MIRVGMILACVASAHAAGAQEPAVPVFADETASSGLLHSFTGEWTFMVGGGAAVFDCNADMKPELFVAGGTAKAQLFRNDSPGGGALKFTPSESGLELDQVTGAYPLDIDSDGITDLVLLRVGPDRLMKGLGDCQFSDAGKDWGFDGLDLWSTAFAATWEKGQDWPTLAIGSYIDRAQEAFPWGSCTPGHLYRPQGKGFAPPLPLAPGHCALSMLFTDWDRSGQPSLRVSNDREYYKGGQEQLWHMAPDAPPALYTDAEGWARLRIWGMGIASADLTGDGYPDYFLTSMADNKLQTLTEAPSGNDLRPVFKDIAFPRGVTAHRPHTGDDLRPSTAWHAEFGDVNNDGLPDLYIVKGNVWDMPDFAEKDPNNLLLQRADGSFAESSVAAGTASFAQGRGGALVDLNMDGMLDMVAVNRNQPTEIWRNTGMPPAGNWVKVRLTQPDSNRDAIGAIVELRRTDGSILTREITLGGGHAGGQLGWQHFGLGGDEYADVRVIWPGGASGDWQRLEAGAHFIIAPDQDPVGIAMR